MTEYFKDTPFQVFQNEYVGAVVMPGGAPASSSAMHGRNGQNSVVLMDWLCCTKKMAMIRPVSKNITEAELPVWPKGWGQPWRCDFLCCRDPVASRTAGCSPC